MTYSTDYRDLRPAGAKGFRGGKSRIIGRVILAVGFALGLAVSAIISALYPSPMLQTEEIEVGFRAQPLNCNCDKNHTQPTTPMHSKLQKWKIKSRSKKKLKPNILAPPKAAAATTTAVVESETVLPPTGRIDPLASGDRTHRKRSNKNGGDSSSNIPARTTDVNPGDYLILDGNKSDIPDFDPTARVVIVTKIQGMRTVGALNQSLCLLTYAYNDRVTYDIVVFSATQIMEKQLELIRTTVYPANLTFIIDNPGVQEMVDALDDDRKRHLLNRCNVTNSTELTWLTPCLETSSSGTSNMPIQYTWQAEFRSLHLWNHPALAKYKYMLWMDTDGFCTKVWKQDPIAAMRRNNMVFLFDHFPMGYARGTEWPYLSNQAFGKTYCEIRLSKKGHLKAVPGNCLGKHVRLNQAHGFFHFTDLDFYRSAPAMKWLKIMIGNSTFSRMYDDQIAVTMPAAVLAGNRSWDLRTIGMNLSVVHDFLLDGRTTERVGGYIGFWKNHANRTFPEAYGKCNAISPG